MFDFEIINIVDDVKIQDVNQYNKITHRYEKVDEIVKPITIINMRSTNRCILTRDVMKNLVDEIIGNVKELMKQYGDIKIILEVVGYPKLNISLNYNHIDNEKEIRRRFMLEHRSTINENTPRKF